jgi:ATP-dependent DNA ligase
MEPMLSAISETGIPKGDSWEYEPKWDGFRTLVFRDGDEVALMSRGGRPMTRYFPELLPAFRKLPESKLVLDGEVVVVGANGLEFGALQQRVHPAESRVRMLSEQTPAWFIAFDVLAIGDDDLRKEPLGTRRIYRRQEDGVAAVRAYLLQVWGEAGARFRLMAENTSDDD